jgi:hemolysin activation/secretion protein
LAFVAPSIVWAQGLPASVNPNRLSDQLKAPTEKPPSVEFDVPAPAPEARPPANADKIQFTLSRVTIEGATALPAGGFEPIYGARVGQAVTLAEVYQWADAITRTYREAGYVLSRAIVPAQRISGGAVRIVVVEGYIDQVKIQGDTSPKLVEYGEQLKASRPLKAEDLERYLLLANELPGVTVRSVLEPSQTAPGASDLTLVASEKLLDTTFEIDNRGTRYIGPWQGYASASLNDVLGLNERSTLRYATTPSIKELSYLEFTETAPVDDDGTSLLFDASRTRSAPGFTLSTLGAHTTAESLLLGIKHEFIRQRDADLTLGLNFDYRDGTTRLKPVPAFLPPNSDDKIRAFRLNGVYDLADPYDGQDQISFELSQGVPIFDASGSDNPIPSRPGADSTFTKLVVGVSRTTDFGHDLGLLTAVLAQTSFGTALTSGEQFGLGGAQYGRGYDPSEVTGDDGVAGKVELQWTPNLDLGELRYTQFYTFYDLGKTTNNHSGAIVPGFNNGAGSLASAGIGTRLALFDNYTSNLELAKPLTREVAADRGHGDAKAWHFYFSLVASF